MELSKGITKRQLQKVWRQLDSAQEAMERLGEQGVDVFQDYRIDESAIQRLKNDVMDEIDTRTGKRTSRD